MIEYTNNRNNIKSALRGDRSWYYSYMCRHQRWHPWDSHGSCCGNNRFGRILMVARVWTPNQEEELVWTVAWIWIGAKIATLVSLPLGMTLERSKNVKNTKCSYTFRMIGTWLVRVVTSAWFWYKNGTFAQNFRKRCCTKAGRCFFCCSEGICKLCKKWSALQG